MKYYLAGFADGDGCFSVNIHKKKTLRLGVNVIFLFQVYQNKNNDFILYLFKEVLKCGYVSKKGGNPLCHVYCVSNTDDIMSKVVPFFRKYQLIGKKHNDFELFTKIVEMKKQKKHLGKEGLIEMINLAYKMNDNGKFRKISKEEIINSIF